MKIFKILVAIGAFAMCYGLFHYSGKMDNYLFMLFIPLILLIPAALFF